MEFAPISSPDADAAAAARARQDSLTNLLIEVRADETVEVRTWLEDQSYG